MLAQSLPAPARPRPCVVFAKAIGLSLLVLLLSNIAVLGTVGMLKGLGVPKSVANPLQLLYLPLMWVALRGVRRRLHLPALLRPARRWGWEVGAALLLVSALGVGIVAVLQAGYGLAATYRLHTHDLYRWGFMATLLLSTAAVEELLFRQVVLSASRLISRSFVVLTLLNASLFLALHVQGFFLGDYTLLWGGAIFAIGLLLSAYVLTFRSLWFPIAFHGCWNISTTLYAEDDKTFNLVNFQHFAQHELTIANVTAMGCIGVCLLLYGVLFYRYNAHKRDQVVSLD